MLSHIAFTLNEHQASRQELLRATAIVEQLLQEDPANYEMWRKLWSHSINMIRVTPSLPEKSRWLEKSKDVVLRTAQNINTENHPEFFQWMKSAEESLAQEKEILEAESQALLPDEEPVTTEAESATDTGDGT